MRTFVVLPWVLFLLCSCQGKAELLDLQCYSWSVSKRIILVGNIMMIKRRPAKRLQISRWGLPPPPAPLSNNTNSPPPANALECTVCIVHCTVSHTALHFTYCIRLKCTDFFLSSTNKWQSFYKLATIIAAQSCQTFSGQVGRPSPRTISWKRGETGCVDVDFNFGDNLMLTM